MSRMYRCNLIMVVFFCVCISMPGAWLQACCCNDSPVDRMHTEKYGTMPSMEMCCTADPADGMSQGIEDESDSGFQPCCPGAGDPKHEKTGCHCSLDTSDYRGRNDGNDALPPFRIDFRHAVGTSSPATDSLFTPYLLKQDSQHPALYSSQIYLQTHVLLI